MRYYFVGLILISTFLALISCNNAELRESSSQINGEINNFVHLVVDAKKSAKIDSFFTTKYRYRAFNGTVLIGEKGRIVYENAFGFANFKKKDSLKTNSIFQLASVSKPLTSFAVLMLYDQGNLDLEDDVQKYFPGFPYENITIRMLLSHRSGLPEYMYFADKLWPSRTKPISNKDVLNLMIKFKPYKYYDPGKRYNYSNTNYCLLVLIIEKVSGMSFEKFMKSQIFEPLGMNDSYVLRYEDIKEHGIENVVVGYNKRGRRAENSYLNGVVGDKGIFSTVEDLFKWDTAIYQDRLVSEKTMEEAFKPAHKDLRPNDNYGFGWRINENDGDKIVFHSGWWKGFRTYYIRKLSQQKTIIVLTNTARYNFISIRKLIGLI
jgi:CubicO group peptidase (beta-lactamase class C family)